MNHDSLPDASEFSNCLSLYADSRHLLAEVNSLKSPGLLQSMILPMFDCNRGLFLSTSTEPEAPAWDWKSSGLRFVLFIACIHLSTDFPIFADKGMSSKIFWRPFDELPNSLILLCGLLSWILAESELSLQQGPLVPQSPANPVYSILSSSKSGERKRIIRPCRGHR